MKYLLRRNGAVVIAVITIADNEDIPSGFEEITLAQYNQAQGVLVKDSYLLYDVETGVFTSNSELASQAAFIANKIALRSRLMQLSIEIDLAARMSESTGDLESQFDDLKVEYDALE